MPLCTSQCKAAFSMEWQLACCCCLCEVLHPTRAALILAGIHIKAELEALLQESIAQLQGQVDQMAELVSRSTEASCLAGTQGLQNLAGLQTAGAEQAQQVCSALSALQSA